jgi:hypothetical protein
MFGVPNLQCIMATLCNLWSAENCHCLGDLECTVDKDPSPATVAVRSCENQKRIHFVTDARTGCLLSHARGGGPTCPRAEAAGLPAGGPIDAARGAGQPRAPGFAGARALGLRAAPARMRAAAGPRRRAPSCLGWSSTIVDGPTVGRRMPWLCRPSSVPELRPHAPADCRRR